MNYNIRKLKENEQGILEDFLYEAIYVPKGEKAPSKKIIEQPQLQVYISDWGKADDYCLVAEVNERVVGAIWVRIMNDYGHVDDKIPSFAISVYKEFRGMGIGTQLMQHMLCVLKEKGYQKASLSVQKANYAYKMYLKLGFEIVAENAEEFLMIKKLNRVL